MRCVLDGISEDTSKIFMSIKHSKLQLAILSLYKEFLRAGKRGPPGLQEYVRMRFRGMLNTHAPSTSFKQSLKFTVKQLPYHILPTI